MVEQPIPTKEEEPKEAPQQEEPMWKKRLRAMREQRRKRVGQIQGSISTKRAGEAAARIARATGKGIGQVTSETYYGFKEGLKEPTAPRKLSLPQLGLPPGKTVVSSPYKPADTFFVAEPGGKQYYVGAPPKVKAPYQLQSIMGPPPPFFKGKKKPISRLPLETQESMAETLFEMYPSIYEKLYHDGISVNELIANLRVYFPSTYDELREYVKIGRRII